MSDDAQDRIGARSLRILVVDDNEVNRKVAIGLLKRLGYSADVATNGLEALEALDRAPYDLVLMDVQMPEMDGLQATREIRRRWPSGGPRVVAMTAHALQSDRDECFAAGMDDFVSKPVDLERVRLAVEGSTTRAAEPAPPDPDAGPDDMHLRVRLAEIRELDDEDESLVAELVDMFLVDADAQVAALDGDIERGDVAAVARTAHTFKGNALTMGAPALAALCSELEDAGRKNVAEAMPALLDKIRTSYAAVRRLLEAER